MRHLLLPPDSSKGWYAGPWESTLPVSVGYATQGIDEPHLHPKMAEVYLVARGTSQIRVGLETIELSPGSVLIVEPGEPHSFVGSSADYMHFVLHVALTDGGLDVEKIPVPRSELGLEAHSAYAEGNEAP